MPNTPEEQRAKAEVLRRGGAKRIRTQKTGPNTYRLVYVVPKRGPHGGHTVAGPKRRDKTPTTGRTDHGA